MTHSTTYRRSQNPARLRYSRFDGDTQAAVAPEGAKTEAGPSVAAVSGGLFFVVLLFTLSLMIPMRFYAGPVMLMPYRLLLLIAFVPLLIRLVSGRAGGIIAVDWLFMLATLWAVLALMVNHPLAISFEASGVHIVEFFGAYLVGRTAVRSAEDFRKMVMLFFFVVIFLLPFAFFESVTRQPILLDLIPNSINPVNAGVRWGMRRAQTAFAHPIHYGAFVSTGLGLFWFALSPTASFGKRVLLALITAVATLFSLSTGAQISIVFQSIFIGWELATRPAARRWTVFAWGCVASYVVIDLLATKSPFHVVVNYASFSANSAYNRIRIWNFGTDNVAQNPIFGLGLNDWVRPGWMSASVDNFWLLIAMRYGLPGALFFIAAVLIIVRRTSLAPLVDDQDRACRAGFLVSLGGVVVAGATVHYWQGIMSFMIFFMASGIWMFTGGARSGSSAPPADTGRRRPKMHRA